MSKKQRKPHFAEKQPLTEHQLAAMSEIFPGFGAWYREHYATRQAVQETTPQHEQSEEVSVSEQE